MKVFEVMGTPVGKPRMTRRDKWKQRPCVMTYRAWADAARAMMGRTTKLVLEKPMRLTVTAFFEIPASHRRTIPGNYHTGKPDGDNILKSVCDALFQNDQMVVEASITKFWAGNDGARVEIKLEEAI